MWVDVLIQSVAGQSLPGGGSPAGGSTGGSSGSPGGNASPGGEFNWGQKSGVGDLVTQAFNTVAAFADTGVKIIDAISKGIASAMGDITKVGAQLGGMLLDGVTSFLGKSGQGIQQAVRGVFGSVTTIAGEVFGGITDLFKTGLKNISTIYTGVGAIAGGVVGAVVGNAPGAAIGAVAGAAILNIATTMLTQLLESMGDLVGKFISRLGTIFGAIGQAFGQIISGIVSVLQDSINTARRISQDVLSIRNNTGMSTGAASAMYSNLRALGVSGNTITSMFNSPVQSPEFFGMRARAYGLSGDMSSPKFIDDLARKFQEMSSQGPLGRMQAMGMMENLGLNNPEMIKLVNTPVQQIKEQQQWQANVDDKLGMSPAAIEKIGERLGLLLQRFEYFADAAKAKLAEGLLPTLEGALEAAANFMAKNSDKIADAIKAAMEWTYAVLPKLILNGASIALGALSALMHGIGSFFEEFAQGKGFLEGMLRPVAQFWDMVVEGLKRAYATGQAVFSALNPLDRRRVEDVYKESYDSFLPGGSDMSGRLDEIEKGGFADKVAAGFHRIGDMADSAKLQVDKTNTDLGTIEQRRNDIKNLEHLPVISKTNQQLLDETKKQNEKNSTAPSMGEFHARAYMEQMIVQGMRRARTR